MGLVSFGKPALHINRTKFPNSVEQDICQHVELITRVCTCTTNRMKSDTWGPFVDKLVQLRHETSFEHCRMAIVFNRFTTPMNEYEFDVINSIIHWSNAGRYLTVTNEPGSLTVRIEGNLHAWRDFFRSKTWRSDDYRHLLFAIATRNDSPFKRFFSDIVMDESKSLTDEDLTGHCVSTATVEESQIFSFLFTISRILADELARHRVGIMMESTRWCNYLKRALTVMWPNEHVEFRSGVTGWLKRSILWASIQLSGLAYLALVALKVPPQHARNCLPLAICTNLWMSATIDEWYKVLLIRSAPNVHPGLLPHLRGVKEYLMPYFSDDQRNVMDKLYPFDNPEDIIHVEVTTPTQTTD